MLALADAPEKIRALDAYWTSLAGGNPPERATVDLEQIKPLMPYLMIVEFETEPFMVRYRLSGTKVDQWNGLNLAGRTLKEFIETDTTGSSDHILECYELSWRTGKPCASAYDWPNRSGAMLRVWFGVFPLTVEGVVCQAMSIEDYTELPPIYDPLPWIIPKR